MFNQTNNTNMNNLENSMFNQFNHQKNNQLLCIKYLVNIFYKIKNKQEKY